MSGPNWQRSGTDAQGQFDQGNHNNFFRNNSFMGQPSQQSAANGMMGSQPVAGPQDGMPSLHHRPTQEEISAVLSQYAPGSSANGSFRPPMYAHPSQISMSSQSSGGVPPTSNGLGISRDVDGGNHGPHRPSPHYPPPGMNLDPAAAAAAAAAYGHLGYGGAAASSDPRRLSQAGADSKGFHEAQMAAQLSGMGSMPGMGMMPAQSQSQSQSQSQRQGQGQVPSQGHGQGSGHGQGFDPYVSQLQGQGNNGFDNDGILDAGSANDDFGPGKKRRMTFAGQFQSGTSPTKSHMLQHDASVGLMHEFGSGLESTQLQYQGSAGPQPVPTRPPFLHRRSRSGSELAGNLPSFRSTTSFDSLSRDAQGFPGAEAMGSGHPVFLSSHSHQPSFTRGAPLPPSALGGHAASHPPGLGSQILRGVDVSASGSSAASDFTKRKGWTGRVVEELLDFVHVLDPEGVILFASPSVYSLTGWTSDELRGRKLTEFVHPQDVASVEREIDRMRSSKGELLTYYRFKTKFKGQKTERDKSGKRASSSTGDADEGESTKGNSDYAAAFTRDGEFVVFEASGHPYFPPKPITVPSTDAREGTDVDGGDGDQDPKSTEEGARTEGLKAESMFHSASGSKQGSSHPSSQSQSLDTPSETSSQVQGTLQCFFCSARPYPSKNTSMLDSFLELKLENEKLRLLIADMDLTGPDNDAEKANFTAAYHPDLLKQELEGDGPGGPWRHGVNPMFGNALAHHQDPKFSQTPGLGGMPGGGPSRHNSMGSHPTSPTMRTGPGFKDDLLASVTGIGNDSDEEPTSPTTANGASMSGSQGLIDESRRKKKPKQDDGDHVCTDCGRVDSPEWRKGPLGPKTLCNACGLRWAKKIKRKGGDAGMAAGMLMQPPGMAQQLLGQGHPLQHSFTRAPDGQMHVMGMPPPPPPPPGSINTMGMGVGQPGGMLPTSPIFSSRLSFDEGQGPGQGQG